MIKKTSGSKKVHTQQATDGMSEDGAQREVSALHRPSPEEGRHLYFRTLVQELEEGGLWICLVLSQLRSPVSVPELKGMLAVEHREDCHAALAGIRHLIHGQEEIEIADRHFAAFLPLQFPEYIKICRENLVTFCDGHPESPYAAVHLVYHYASAGHTSKALANCTQEWADRLAHRHRSPDLILSDIKHTAMLAADTGQPGELIRLLLLLQRIAFRYRTVLSEFTAESVQTLLAQKKYAEAVSLLVEQNTLLTDPAEALHFLPYFYAHEAWAEAELLHHALEKQAAPAPEWSRKNVFSRNFETPASCAKTVLQERNRDRLKVRKVWDCGVAYHHPNMLSYGRMHTDITEVENNTGAAADRSWAGVYAQSLIAFSTLFSSYNLPDVNTGHTEAKVRDGIEYLLKHYGCTNDKNDLKVIIQALSGNPVDIGLLSGLMNSYLQFGTGTGLRSNNGVDLDGQLYENLCLQSFCRGFLDDGEVMEVTVKNWYRQTWEQDFIQLTEEIHFLEGKAVRYRSSNQLPEKSGFILNALEGILTGLRFSFRARSQWDRSYLIPEELYPLLCSKLLHLIGNYSPAHLSPFLDFLKNGSADQLGLYSEGFRKTLKMAVRSLMVLKYGKENILPLVEIWKSHVLSGVQNRWERAEELLLINEIYGILQEEENAAAVFQDLLDSSMGPVWNQESPLKLVNRALALLKDPASAPFAEFAALLDAASGEMTLPAVIRPLKEEFIGAMIMNGETARAFDYYKFEVSPHPEVVLRNAERSSFDAPTRGAGYHPGARGISEPGAVLQILSTLDCSPYLKWGLCELMMVSTDTESTRDAYSVHLADALNAIETMNDGAIEALCAITAKPVTGERSAAEHRRRLVKQMGPHLTPANRKRLAYYMGNPDAGSPLPANNLYPVPQAFSADISGSLLTGLKNKPALKQPKVKQSLFAVKDRKGEVLRLQKMVADFDGGFGEVPAVLEALMKGGFADAAVTEMYDAISGHLHNLIRPDGEAKQKYAWMKQTPAVKPNDDLTVEFIIWHLNHPDIRLSTKAEEILARLAVFIPGVIGSLFTECISNRPHLASELCSAVLYEISRKAPAELGSYLLDHPRLIVEATRIPHVTVKKNLLDAAGILQNAGYGELYAALKQSLPDAVESHGNTGNYDTSLTAVQEVLDELADEQILYPDFSVQMHGLLEDYCFPLDRNALIRSEWYLRRSFNKDPWGSGTYDYLVRHALNNAVSHRISRENISIVYEIIN